MHDPQNKNIEQYSKHSKKFRSVFIATGQCFEFFYFDLSLLNENKRTDDHGNGGTRRYRTWQTLAECTGFQLPDNDNQPRSFFFLFCTGNPGPLQFYTMTIT